MNEKYTQRNPGTTVEVVPGFLSNATFGKSVFRVVSHIFQDFAHRRKPPQIPIYAICFGLLVVFLPHQEISRQFEQFHPKHIFQGPTFF